MDVKEFARTIISDSDLLKTASKEVVAKIVDGEIRLDKLEVTEQERQEIIDAVIELLPKEGWGE